MLFNSLVPIGGVAVGIMLILVLVYIILSAEAHKTAGEQAQGESPYPLTNDELLYLTSSVYPYPEYTYFPTLAFSMEPQAVAQPPLVHPAPGFALYHDRREAIQPV